MAEADLTLPLSSQRKKRVWPCRGVSGQMRMRPACGVAGAGVGFDTGEGGASRLQRSEEIVRVNIATLQPSEASDQEGALLMNGGTDV
jgi:hypothetical protein